MTEAFTNVYSDADRAASYAGLEYPGTYYLAFRDLPTLIRQHVHGREGLDFGCGTGRSTRFLQGLGFHTLGIDISGPMLAEARLRDPGGAYEISSSEGAPALRPNAYDLILAAFTFDNIPTGPTKTSLFRALRSALRPRGVVIAIVSTPEIYTREWASFSTKDFPANAHARDGDRVRIVMLDVPDRRPVEDVLWTDRAYREVFTAAGLGVRAWHQPLGLSTESFSWVSETRVPAWSIYVLEAATA